MRNIISMCLLVIGILLIVIGLIAGIAVASDDYGNFHFILALYWWLSGIVSGFLFIGLSEIVHLLQEILQKQHNPYKASTQQAEPALAYSPDSNEGVENHDTPLSASNGGEGHVAKIADLAIKLDEERFKGAFLIGQSSVQIVKKERFASEEVVLTIPKKNISSDYQKEKDYLIFFYTKDTGRHSLAFKTYNVYDYERIVNLLSV